MILGKTGLFALLVAWLLPFLSLAQPRPNVILIFADDIGFGDLECYGHPYSETPNLCRLADQGTRFENFYVTGNVCPHSRSGLLTSRNPSWFPNYTAQYGFRGTKTLYNLLQDAGYNTGHIGKWNIGLDPDNQSKEYGIDYHRRVGTDKGDPFGREGKRFSKAMEFLENNAQEPFYLNMWIYATHTPIVPEEQFVDRYRDLEIDYSKFGGHLDNVSKDKIRKYLADLWSLDRNVGRLLDKLDDLGIADNTLIAFTSDNGPDNNEGGYAGGLRKGKHSYYEGGMRVPFLVRYPGKVPAGKVNSQSVMSTLDWLPTICTYAGCNIPWNRVEGEDLTHVLEGSNRSREKPLLWRGICEGANNPGCFNRLYMRYGKWKLHEQSRELYDLSVDSGERNNVYRDHPGVVEAMLESAYDWDSTLPNANARLPSTPLDFNPNKAAPQIIIPNLDGSSGGGGGGGGGDGGGGSGGGGGGGGGGGVCETFTVPFQASALSYCGFLDQSNGHNGNCGSGPVDSLKLESDANKELCQSDCFISHVDAGEYVEYSFRTTASDQTVEISAYVASFSKSKRFELELVGEGSSSGARVAPGKGWRDFEKEVWTVRVDASGSHVLRVTFLDGKVNLCSVSVVPTSNGPDVPDVPDIPDIPDGGNDTPNCELFALPFQTSALSYCSFQESDSRHRGNCGSGPVDSKTSPNCRSCHVAYVKSGEYLDYYFDTTESNLNILVELNVASFNPGRQIELQLLGENSSGRITPPSDGYDEFDTRSWRTTLANSGLHSLRVLFLDDNINFCSIEVKVV